MTAMDAVWMVVVTLVATLLQQYLLSRSVSAASQQHNVVRMSPLLRHVAQTMVGMAVAITVFAVYKYQGMLRLAPLVCALVLGGLGAAILWVGRRWYVAVAPTYVQYHRGIGQARQIVFSDIAALQDKTINGMPHLRVKARNGWRVDVPLQALDARPLQAWQAFVNVHQRAPTAEEWAQCLHGMQR